MDREEDEGDNEDDTMQSEVVITLTRTGNTGREQGGFSCWTY